MVDLKKWFKSKWFKNFQHKDNVEIVQKLEFDKMRLIYELKKLMTPEQIELFQIEVIEKLDMYRNEMLFQKITYYSMRFVTKKTYFHLELELTYIQSETDVFEIYEKGLGKYRSKKSQKLVMDGENLKKYLAIKNAEEFKLMIVKKSS